MQKAFLYLSSLILMVYVMGCFNAPDFSDTPEISFTSMSKDTLIQGSTNEDSLWVNIYFTDGDGDLGDNQELNVFIQDTRDGFFLSGYRIPFIPEEGSGNGIDGQLQLLFFNSCCTYDDGTLPCSPSVSQPFDQVIYEISIRDRAGNESNKLPLPAITLICN